VQGYYLYQNVKCKVWYWVDKN